jgi:phage anti-repressor protein
MDIVDVQPDDTVDQRVDNTATALLEEFIFQHEKCVRHQIEPIFVYEFAFALESKNPFPINADLAMKWIGYTRKDVVKRVLESEFAKDEGYIILENGHGAKDLETIMLSIDCFKIMSMRSNTEMGRRVRRYYLAMEGIAKDYINFKLNEVAKANDTKIKELEMANDIKIKELEMANDRLIKALSKNPYENAECVYLIKSSILTDDRPLFKVGRTTNIKRREGQYNTHNPDEVCVIYERKCADCKIVEEMFKQLMIGHEYIDRKEHYLAPATLMKNVIDYIVDFMDSKRRIIENAMVAFAQGEQMPEIIDKTIYKNAVDQNRAKLNPIGKIPKREVAAQMITDDDYTDFINGFLAKDDAGTLTRLKLAEQLKLSPIFEKANKVKCDIGTLMNKCIAHMGAVEVNKQIRGWRLKEISLQQFLDDKCDSHPDVKAKVKNLHQAYLEYCNEKNIVLSNKDVTMFIKNMERDCNMVISSTKGSRGGYEYTGITLKQGSTEQFMDENCIPDENHETQISELWSAYMAYCTTKKLKPCHRATFRQRVGLRFAGYEYNNKCYNFTGVKLKKE